MGGKGWGSADLEVGGFVSLDLFGDAVKLIEADMKFSTP